MLKRKKRWESMEWRYCIRLKSFEKKFNTYESEYASTCHIYWIFPSFFHISILILSYPFILLSLFPILLPTFLFSFFSSQSSLCKTILNYFHPYISKSTFFFTLITSNSLSFMKCSLLRDREVPRDSVG